MGKPLKNHRDKDTIILGSGKLQQKCISKITGGLFGLRLYSGRCIQRTYQMMGLSLQPLPLLSPPHLLLPTTVTYLQIMYTLSIYAYLVSR